MRRVLFLSSLSLIGFLSSCASYRAVSLSPLVSDALICPSSVENKDLVIVARAFDQFECKRYLDRDVLAQGYQPVQLYIENNSNENYLFSLGRVSLICAQPEEVARTVHTSTVGRAVGYGVGALFLWPLAIPAVVDGIKSAEANDHLDRDFYSKAARDQVIQAHSYFNKILFVPINEYRSSFTITLMDRNSNRKTVNIVAS